MEDKDIETQQALHGAVEDALRADGLLGENQILTGWVVCYETDNLAEREDRFAGHFYGPREMSTWRALGLVEWVSRYGLQPADSEE